MNTNRCPHCNKVFITPEALLQHFVDSPECYNFAVSIDTTKSEPIIEPAMSKKRKFLPQKDTEASAAQDVSNTQITNSIPLCGIKSEIASNGIIITRKAFIALSIAIVIVILACGFLVMTIGVLITKHPKHENNKTHSFVQKVNVPTTNCENACVSKSVTTNVLPMQRVQVSALAAPANVTNFIANQSTRTVPLTNKITIKVSSSPSHIHLGESFNLMINVDGVDHDIDNPDLSSLPPADIQFLEQHSNSRSSITIMNGRMTRKSFEGRVYSYKITPRQQGLFNTGPISVRFSIGPKMLTHPGATILVAERNSITHPHSSTLASTIGQNKKSVGVRLGETKEDAIRRYGDPSKNRAEFSTSEVNTNQFFYTNNEPHFVISFYKSKKGKLISGRVTYILPKEILSDKNISQQYVHRILELNARGKKWIEENHSKRPGKVYRCEDVEAYWPSLSGGRYLIITLDEYSIYYEAAKEKIEREKKLDMKQKAIELLKEMK